VPQAGQSAAALYQTSQTTRDGHVEALARREQAALQSQQVALEALAQQAAKDSDETATLRSELKNVEAKEAALEELVQRQSKELLAEKAGHLRAQAQLQDQQASLHRAKLQADLAGVAKSSSALLGIAGKSAVEFSLDALKDQLLGDDGSVPLCDVLPLPLPSAEESPGGDQGGLHLQPLGDLQFRR